MLQSMTGFGRASGEFNGKQIQIELKSLNGKATDVRVRIPNNFKEKEILLRNLVLERLHRGKIDLNISNPAGSGHEEFALNKELFAKYYKEIEALKRDLKFENEDALQSILRIPNVMTPVDEEMSEEEWSFVKEVLDKAISNFLSFSQTEGDAMYKDLSLRINNIISLLNSVNPQEGERIEKIKERIRKNLNLHFSSENVDQNRFEQELIYYIEKLDITEEKVRLEQHCNYFLEILNDSGVVKGKKLGFISQEMGREINTLGAKSQDSTLQQIVVNMKDELEKIKEQLANVV